MNYVIYKLTFPDGKYYIGKTKNLRKRLCEHANNPLHPNFTFEVLAKAPHDISNSRKQQWIDNMERLLIHNECEKIYTEITGDNTQFYDYQPFKHIINERLVNSQLY